MCILDAPTLPKNSLWPDRLVVAAGASLRLVAAVEVRNQMCASNMVWYEWKLNDSIIQVGRSPVLLIRNVATHQQGQLSYTALTDGGSVTSPPTMIGKLRLDTQDKCSCIAFSHCSCEIL